MTAWFAAHRIPQTARLEWPTGSLLLTNNEYENSAEAWLTDVAGWEGGVGIDGEQAQRESGHGLISADGRLTGRTLTVKGELFFPDDEESRNLASRYLSSVFGSGKRGTVTCVDGDLTLTARKVRRDGEIKTARVDTEWVEVEIPLQASDPYLYAPERETTVVSAGSGLGFEYAGSGAGADLTEGAYQWGETPPPVVLDNPGTAWSWPTITVTGDSSDGFTITTGTHTITYPDATYRAAPVTVNVRTGQVMVRGRDVSHRLSAREWWGIPPGGLVSPTLTPRNRYDRLTATVRWSPTYE